MAAAAFGLVLLAGEAGAGVIRNDALWVDTNGQEIRCNGGSLLEVGGRFYMVGYDTQWPWHIKLYSSSDLARWTFEKDLVTNTGSFAQLNWAGRPSLLFNEATGKFVLVFEAESSAWTRHKVGIAAADAITGPYELVSTEYCEGSRPAGDMAVYQEGAKAYLLVTLDAYVGGRLYLNQSLAIYELGPDFRSVGRKLFEGFNSGSPSAPRDHTAREATHILKRNGTYYWLSSALAGWSSSATQYATATDLAGPWSALKTLPTAPQSPDSFNTQHDFILPIVGSLATTYVYVGDRWSQYTGRGPGRNVLLPLTWEGDVPTLTWLASWELDVVTGLYWDASKPPTCAVTAPNGGEKLPGGSVQPVRWTTTGSVPTVDVDLSLNGAAGPWVPLATGLANTGSANLALPAANAAQCRIRVRGAGGAPVDLSDADFELVAPRDAGSPPSTPDAGALSPPTAPPPAAEPSGRVVSVSGGCAAAGPGDGLGALGLLLLFASGPGRLRRRLSNVRMRGYGAPAPFNAGDP